VHDISSFPLPAALTGLMKAAPVAVGLRIDDWLWSGKEWIDHGNTEVGL